MEIVRTVEGIFLVIDEIKLKDKKLCFPPFSLSESIRKWLFLVPFLFHPKDDDDMSLTVGNEEEMENVTHPPSVSLVFFGGKVGYLKEQNNNQKGEVFPRFNSIYLNCSAEKKTKKWKCDSFQTRNQLSRYSIFYKNNGDDE